MESKVICADIYWANSLFSEADLHLNNRYASLLRSKGYSVFLPQEASINQRTGDRSPTAHDVFLLDTSTIVNSRLMVACIDQETIDSGVACEIGLAYSYGIPVIGLYTDLRQHRSGPGRMYKNLYVIGAIEAYGEIVSDEEELLQVIPRYIGTSENGSDAGILSEDNTVHHLNSIASKYSEYVSKLESFYRPRWSANPIVRHQIETIGARRILEFGSGTGSLGGFLSRDANDLFYVGFDLSVQMTEIASSAHGKENVAYTSDWDDVVGFAESKPFDIAVALFSIHDLDDQKETLNNLAKQVGEGGRILVIDLTTHDLPHLTNLIKRHLARPALVDDKRLDPLSVFKIARDLDLDIEKYRIELTCVVFPSYKDLDEYFTMFSIYEGMDLPLGITEANAQEAELRIRSFLDGLEYPLLDQRVFSSFVLRKHADG